MEELSTFYLHLTLILFNMTQTWRFYVFAWFPVTSQSNLAYVQHSRTRACTGQVQVLTQQLLNSCILEKKKEKKNTAGIVLIS